MRLLSTIAIALWGAALAGCATNGGYSAPNIATSSKAGWGPHGKPLYYWMVLSNPAPGKEKEFNTWYDRIHAPYLIAEGDFVWAQRFELVKRGTPGLETRQYMVIFAIETNDLKGTLAAVDKHLGLPRNVQSASLDGSSLQSVTWEALGPPTTQKDAALLLAEEMAAGRLPKVGEGPAPGTEERFYRPNGSVPDGPSIAPGQNGPLPQGTTPAR
jgi:hypothetical protein